MPSVASSAPWSWSSAPVLHFILIIAPWPEARLHLPEMSLEKLPRKITEHHLGLQNDTVVFLKGAQKEAIDLGCRMQAKRGSILLLDEINEI